MQDLIKLRNANVALWNHMNQPKTGPEVPIGHDHTFPIIVELVDTIMEMQDVAKFLLEVSIEHEDALEEAQEALTARNEIDVMQLDVGAPKSEQEELLNKKNRADDEYMALHRAQIALGDKVTALKKQLAGKIAPAILQLDLIAASCNVELYNNVPAFFNAFAKQNGLLGVEI